MIPNGVLNPDGQNTLALAVTSDGGPGNGLEKVALTNLGTVRGGVPVQMDRSSAWNAAHLGLARRAQRGGDGGLSRHRGQPGARR